MSRQGLVIGSPSSLKKLEPLYMDAHAGVITYAGSSIVEYERWLQIGDQQILDDIEAYNRDDVESTWRLRDWLEARRGAAPEELGDHHGALAIRLGRAEQNLAANFGERLGDFHPGAKKMQAPAA